MPPSASRQLLQILNKTKQPLFTDLKNDFNCPICHEVFLSGEEPEAPIKLSCGHICGQSCMLKWLSPLSVQGHNSCPICRHTIIDDWRKRPEHNPPQNVGGIRAEEPSIHGNSTIGSSRVGALEANFQRYAQYYERRMGASLQDPATLPGSSGANTQTNRIPRVAYIHMELGRVQREQEETNRRLWIKFCEGVVRIVETSGYLNTCERLPVARLVLAIESYEAFVRLRSEDPATHQRILRTFPRLHTEMVINHAIPSISFGSFADFERIWYPRTDFFTCHVTRWRERLEQHGNRISATYPLGQRPVEAVGNAGASEPEASSSRARVGTTNNVPPVTSIVFRMHRLRWAQANRMERARIVSALASRMGASLDALGDDYEHMKFEVSSVQAPANR